MSRRSPKKSSARRRYSVSYASMGRAALLKEYKRLRPRTPKATMEKLKGLSREALLGRVILAARPKKDPYAKLEGMSRRELINHLKEKRGGRGKKAGGRKKGRGKKSGGFFGGDSKKYEDAEINALLAEQKREEAAKYAASFNRDKGGRRGKKAGKKGKKLSRYARFVKAFAKSYRGRKPLMVAAGATWSRMSEAQKAKFGPAPKTAKKAPKKPPKKRSSGRVPLVA